MVIVTVVVVRMMIPIKGEVRITCISRHGLVSVACTDAILVLIPLFCAIILELGLCSLSNDNLISLVVTR